jgi:hypothetical protein
MPPQGTEPGFEEGRNNARYTSPRGEGVIMDQKGDFKKRKSIVFSLAFRSWLGAYLPT